jgi:tetratricopeptide (TPR) repeat protein
MDEREAVAALISDLRWQVEQMRPRGITDAAGNPYNPSHYKRGLQAAIEKGGLSVVEFVLRYVNKAPSSGFEKLEGADSLDLACEALVADPDKPYAELFTEADRARAQKRLAPHIAAIEQRKTDREDRITQRRADLPEDLEHLKDLAASTMDPEDSIAINSQILLQEPNSLVALNRLGRAYESTGAQALAIETFQAVLEIDPTNTVATRRLADLERKRKSSIKPEAAVDA